MEKTMEKTIKQLDQVYQLFFDEMKIDKNTGVVSGTNKRFVTKPAIGKNYFKSERKVLFVSLDVGKDELFVEKGINAYQSIESRTESVCYSQPTNPHMSGVYGTSLYLLKEKNNWDKESSLMENSSVSFLKFLNENFNEMPKEVLSNISLINFYNFVEIGREKRVGNSDRKFLNKKAELKLVIDILNVLKPNDIIVQGFPIHKFFNNEIKSKLDFNCKLYNVIHPSVFGRYIKYQIPNNYFKHLEEMKIEH